MYFLTFRLADSIPTERLRQLEAERAQWRQRYPRMTTTAQWVEYHRLFSDRVEGWLDDNVGKCQLGRADCAGVVAESLGYGDGDQYRLDHWVIMPNHVHVLFVECPGSTMEVVVQRWKSITGRRVNEFCGRKGPLWQAESFDHIVRSQAQLQRYRDYIIANASKAQGRGVISTRMAVP
jgi:hypothetical protein